MIDNLKNEINRRLNEGANRVDICLSMISKEEFWQKPGRELVSIGNLVNHLCGNLSQWVLKELGGQAYNRQRDREFTDTTGEEPAEAAARLRAVVDQARAVVTALTESDLERTYTVQGFQETGVGILVHVVEHLSYHVGQITFYVKLIKDVDVGYYQGVNLEKP